ncbi:Tyrosine-protein kinase Wzc [Pantoea sp. AS-PWVM4]|uniref:polysaccharide biosynthesis tyrosine autokinase n=1 Tax=Pantoea sp. AS-PWVM4 TaxID=1332069 RepID=UPI0003AC7A3A|nr:polysaccharide biosynthesis tyrosine autokinase [Pantoea sp. AS-PWVM4]ERK09458.1 Tyrosine-protein kinase Wzc [Pantoea sp. AS-PWVM4]
MINRTEGRITNAITDEIDIGKIAGEILDRKKLIISVTAIFAVISVVYALFASPVYQADALIQVEQKQGNEILDTLNQVLPTGTQPSAPEITLLQSRMVLGKTVEDLNLEINVKQDYFPVFGSGWARMTGQKKGKLDITRLYLSQVDGKDIDADIEVLNRNEYKITVNDVDYKGRVGELLNNKAVTIMVNNIDADPGTSFTVSTVGFLKAINNIKKFYNVDDEGKDTGMLILTLTGEDNNKIKSILDSISNNYLEQNVERQAAQDEKSLEFLKVQLPKVRDDLDKAEDRLNDYRRQKDSVDLSMEAQTVLNQIVNVDNQINELTFREAEISQLYTKDHPTYKALLEKKRTLSQEKNKLNEAVNGMPSTQQEIIRLSRDVDSGRAVYMQLLNRQQELSISKSSAIGNVRIIDPAVTEPEPVKPKKILVVLIGTLLGGFLTVIYILIKILIRKGIEKPDDLEVLGINVYANIPFSEWQDKNSQKLLKRKRNEKNQNEILSIENPADLAIEALRSLRTSLHFAMMEAKNNVVMISGASPESGKSFISSNLAVIVSEIKKRVLLIDADMRKGKSHIVLNKVNDKGLSEYLSGKSSINEILKSKTDSLTFISRGAVPPNPSELLMHHRLQELLAWASENYDLVIVDTPPILAVTDAAIIGQYVGTNLLVARYETNTAKEIEFSKRRFEDSGIIVKGAILNAVKKSTNSYYSYGYSYDSDKK